MLFEERLKAARKAKKLTQKEVAEALNVTTSTYCGYETGKRKPDVFKIKKLAEILGVPADVLLGTEQLLEQETFPSPVQTSNPEITDDALRFALWGGDAEQITQEQLDEVKRFAAFVRERDKK